MCPSEELRASFEYSVKRQTRLRISFFLFFLSSLSWSRVQVWEPIFLRLYHTNLCFCLGKATFLLDYLCTKPISTRGPWVPIIYRYVSVLIIKETEKGKKLTDSHTDKKKNSERKFRAVRPKASRWPEKGFLPSRHNEAICRIFCLGSLRFTSNLAFVC